MVHLASGGLFATAGLPLPAELAQPIRTNTVSQDGFAYCSRSDENSGKSNGKTASLLSLG